MTQPTDPQHFPAREAALSYARAGWPVVALAPGSDVPLYAGPTTDAATIVRWFAECPLANVGLALGVPAGGAVGICALASDDSSAARAWLEAKGAFEQLGSGHVLSRGETVWLFACQRPLADRAVAPGVVLRGDGVLAMPPSHLADGRDVQWRKGKHFAERALSLLPRWLLLEAEAPVAPAAQIAVSDDWQRDLVRSAQGGVKPTFGNLCTILRSSDRYAGRLAYDEMRLTPTLEGRVIGDEHVGRIREQVEREFGCPPAEANLRHALLTVAAERPRHPVREYLQAVKWDGLSRIARVGPELLGVEPTALAQKMLRSWFVSAIARAMAPGCKVDTALVLMGPQGARKSTFFRTLAGEWFSDTHMDITDKDSLLQIADAWVYEWSEIENVTSRKQAGEVKMFVTSQVDAFRPPFEKSVRRVPRTAVIVGTTNKERFLSDETGSRRFWVLRVTRRVDIDSLASWRDQLWAEALEAFRQKEPWWLEADDDRDRESLAEEFQEEDAWQGEVATWLRSNLRANYTSNELLTEALRIDRRDMGPAQTQRLGRCMHGLGLVRRKLRIVRGGRTLVPTWAWWWTDEAPAWLEAQLPVEDRS